MEEVGKKHIHHREAKWPRLYSSLVGVEVGKAEVTSWRYSKWKMSSPILQQPHNLHKPEI